VEPAYYTNIDGKTSQLSAAEICEGGPLHYNWKMPHALSLNIVIFINVTWTLNKDLLYEEINTQNRYHSRTEINS